MCLEISVNFIIDIKKKPTPVSHFLVHFHLFARSIFSGRNVYTVAKARTHAHMNLPPPPLLLKPITVL